MSESVEPLIVRRSLFDAVAGRNAPIAPGGDPHGFLLRDMGERECRFPTGSGDSGTRFCAMPVEASVWRVPQLNGSYCRFHRDFLRTLPRVTEDEAGAA